MTEAERADGMRWRLIAVLLFASIVRLVDLDWDQGHAFHPDERAIAFAVERLSWHPLQLNPGFFAYGSLPMYATRAASEVARRLGWSHDASFATLLLTGRTLSAAAGVVTVLVLFALGRRLFGTAVGLLAALLLAACVLHIQQSHFMTSDVFVTLFVLASLWRLVGVVERGWTRDYAYAGICMGLALATKASAAPLAVPLAVATALRLRRESTPGPVLGRSGLALLAAAATFAAGQPYALLDLENFWSQLAEQGRIVRHAGIVPYTVQYIGAPKFAYELGQMVLWGMAPLLGIVATWATATRAIALLRNRSDTDLVLAAWAIPYFLLTGWFEVKYMRYLLPVYPIFILWAARWLWQRAQRDARGRRLLWLVSAGTLVSALAFLGIYRGPHTAVAASEWVYAHVPAGSTLLTEEWDEGFPLSLTVGRPSQYRVVPLPYYAPDTADKIRALSRELAGGAFLVLPTKRLYGAITNVPARYPLTSNYFQLLFAGELGYRLVYERASRPALLALEFPDELADESFSVYDHPKVLIFENVGHFTAVQLADKILNDRPRRALTRTDLLLAGPTGPPLGRLTAHPSRSSGWALFSLALAVELLGAAAYVLLRRWLPELGGYAACKVLGLLAFAQPPWLLTALGLTTLSHSLLLAMFLLLVTTAALIASRSHPGNLLPRDAWPTELLFWGTSAYFLAVRAWNPAIFWGEKPMDFALLNTLMRATTFPPPEPWFGGAPLHYTYFGHYLVAALGTLCNVHPALTFNIGIGVFGGLTAVAAYALGCAIRPSWRTGIVAGVLTVMAGNLAGPLELMRRRAVDFDYFWATSRVIAHTINEYPLWSLLFADLHAHLLVMPLSLVSLTLAVWWTQQRRGAILPVLGLTLGALMMTNGWSTPVHVLFVPLLLTCASIAEAPASLGMIGWMRRLILQVLVPTAVVLTLAGALYSPFIGHYRPPTLGWGWERESVHFADYALIFGFFLFVGVSFLFWLWRRIEESAEAPGQAPAWVRRLFGVVVALLFALTLPAVQSIVATALWRASPPAQTQRWLQDHLGSVYLGLVLLGALGLYLATRRQPAQGERVIAVMLALGFFVTAGCDVLYVWDRMNTIFKHYVEAWLLFAAASAAALPSVWRDYSERRWLREAWQSGAGTLAAAALFTTATCTYATLRTERVATPRPSLDGMAYLAQRNPEESAAIDWLNDSVAEATVVAEATGPAYQDFSRISMNTGLPTVLGWEYHVHQRGQPWPGIAARRRALETLYTSTSESAVAAVLQQYHIGLVYVGDLERQTYKGANVANFRKWPDLLAPVFQSGDVVVFRVRGEPSSTPPLTVASVAPAQSARPLDPGGRLRQPRGVAVDGHGTIYVVDFGNDRINVFNSKLQFVRAWGTSGPRPGQFREPCGIAVDSKGTIYIADTWNHRVEVFDADGAFRAQWTASLFGPRGIAIDPTDALYVTDTGNHRIVRFAADRQVQSFGRRGSAPGEFQDPMGIATDRAGRLYVADNGNGRLQILDATGRFMGGFPVDGWRTEAFSEPGVVVAPDGRIWVTVPLRGVVRAYSRDGRLEREIVGSSLEDAPFSTPMGVAFDAPRRALIVSDLKGRLARISLEPRARTPLSDRYSPPAVGGPPGH
jgi:YYY domain-containing protein